MIRNITYLHLLILQLEWEEAVHGKVAAPHFD